jgi:hypothetical protein
MQRRSWKLLGVRILRLFIVLFKRGQRSKTRSGDSGKSTVVHIPYVFLVFFKFWKRVRTPDQPTNFVEHKVRPFFLWSTRKRRV